MSKKSKRILIISLAVNFLLLGLIGGHLMKTGVHERPGHHKAMERLAAQLPDEKAALLRETMKESREQSKKSWARMHELREQILEILAAETFDEEAYNKLTAQMNALRVEQMSHKAASTGNLAKVFSQEERKKLAEIYREKHQRWKKRHPKRKKEQTTTD